MPKKVTVGDVPGNMLGMLADLMHKLQHGTISPVELERFLKGRNPFEKANAQVEEWKVLYRGLFGLDLDFSDLVVPAERKGFERLIVVAQGMTPQRLFDKCAGLFPAWKWTERSLDEVVHSERTAKDGVYAVWFRDRVEADEELKNLSATALEKRNVSGITLEERLLMELKFFHETGNHLDVQNVTLCSGSRDSYGRVPSVYWFDDRLEVDWYFPDSANDGLRSRGAVAA